MNENSNVPDNNNKPVNNLKTQVREEIVVAGVTEQGGASEQGGVTEQVVTGKRARGRPKGSEVRKETQPEEQLKKVRKESSRGGSDSVRVTQADLLLLQDKSKIPHLEDYIHTSRDCELPECVYEEKRGQRHYTILSSGKTLFLNPNTSQMELVNFIRPILPLTEERKRYTLIMLLLSSVHSRPGGSQQPWLSDLRA